MKTLIPLAESGRINENASVRDSQSTIINATAEKIWAILTDLGSWSDWNQDIGMVKHDQMVEGADFSWSIGGTKIKSTFRKVEENQLLSWTGTSAGIKAIQVWRLEATDGGQTIVSVEESMQGITTIFFSHQKLHSTLLNWLSRLKQRAEKSE